VAVLAFGKASLMPSSAPSSAPNDNRRRLRAPIRGLLTGDDVKAFLAAQQEQQNSRALAAGESESAIVSVAADSSVSQRMLQAGGTQSEFGLQVGLQGINGASNSGQDDTSSSGGSPIVVAVVILILLAAGGGLGFFFCTKRRTRKEEIVGVDKHHHYNHHHSHSSAASVGTYPSQGSVYTSTSGQYANYRGSATRDAQID
jgi:hypothetical protein